MADRVRIGTFQRGGRFSTILDLNDGTVYTFIRDAFKINPSEKTQLQSTSDRRYGGSVIAGETSANGSIETSWYVRGASADDTLVKVESLLAQLESVVPNRFIEWRPEGATRSIYYELRGPGKWTPEYKWITWQAQKVLQLGGSFQIGPLALGDPMDILDDFSVDSIADYTLLSGSGVSVTGGELTPTSTVNKRIRHTARGYSYEDVQVTSEVVFGTTVASYEGPPAVKILDVNNALWATYEGGFLRIYKMDANVNTILAGVAVTAPAAGDRRWIRLRIEGNVVTAEWWTSVPTPLGTPTNTVSYTLTGADATKFGAGVSGGVGLWYWAPHSSLTSGLDSFTVEPWTYQSVVLPQTIRLGGNIPGTAPAKSDVAVTTTGTAKAWALLAWAPQNALQSFVWNGDFEGDTDGWSPAASAFTTASTISHVTANSPKFGNGVMQVVAPGGVANAGAFFRLWTKPLKRGRTYTASAWVRAATGTATAQLFIGSTNTTADSTLSTAVALSPTWTKHTVTWTPTADRRDAQVGLRIPGLVAQTYFVDGVSVYEGTAEPSQYPQAEGRGGEPTLGLIEAENYDVSDISSFTQLNDGSASYSSGGRARWSTSGAGTGTLSYYLDPNLIPPDDFSMMDQRVEVWARVGYSDSHVNPRVVTSLLSAEGAIYSNRRYTEEYGSQGKLLTPIAPGGSQSFRIVRLGTLTLSSDPVNPARWKLYCSFAVGPGSTGNLDVDYFVLAPVRRRAVSPTGKVADNYTYPYFTPSTAETTKWIMSDGSGALQPPASNSMFPDHSLGGQLIEFPPGPINLLVDTTALFVPDDPTLRAGSDSYPQTVSVHARIQPRYFLGRGN